MAIEILRHPSSGELYGVTYVGGPTVSNADIDQVVGPLTVAEAVEIYDAGESDGLSDDDQAWAREIPWQFVDMSALRNR